MANIIYDYTRLLVKKKYVASIHVCLGKKTAASATSVVAQTTLPTTQRVPSSSASPESFDIPFIEVSGAVALDTSGTTILPFTARRCDTMWTISLRYSRVTKVVAGVVVVVEGNVDDFNDKDEVDDTPIHVPKCMRCNGRV